MCTWLLGNVCPGLKMLQGLLERTYLQKWCADIYIYKLSVSEKIIYILIMYLYLVKYPASKSINVIVS